MARVSTNEKHLVVNEGRTGRIIARRALRLSLGNPKKRNKDLQELLWEMYAKGVRQGDQLRQLRIQCATAGLTYEEEPNEDIPVAAVSGDPMSESTLGCITEDGASSEPPGPGIDPSCLPASYLLRSYRHSGIMGTPG